ncbi:hypothetical protein BCIN_16g02930 [Botrytis cinerea B05.10]|uniref:Uncharacterized protein n=1 Tax=Botryotinia fuckeliana (strain B05.10) TaxID=332648 RepID=A0A384K6S4_BOTFB|nr:hypothetical protein BCIN_16g02930 [Botrytis cinerea B05.10]ATZ58535.1 hypothetical protein BCIN_16g02930 [Botrytis cinerea B05.10]
MPNQSSVNRSLSTIRTELEILSQNDVLSLPQFQSIMAQLPQQNGSQTQYTDYRYNPTTNSNPQKMAQEDQDLNHPEHLAHRKNHEWAKAMAFKFEIAAVLGAVLAVVFYSTIMDNL